MRNSKSEVIKLPTNRERDPDQYARTCPKCGGIFYLITLSNKIICENCFVPAEFPDDEI